MSSLASLALFIAAVHIVVLATSVHGGGISNHDLPFTLGIRDSIMIAHSFHDNPAFGPAGKLVREATTTTKLM